MKTSFEKKEALPRIKVQSVRLKGYPSGVIMVLMLKTSALRYSGPPHGGLRKTMSPRRSGANCRKSPCTNSIWCATPYTSALCCARASRTGSISMAITGCQEEKNNFTYKRVHDEQEWPR